MRKPLPALGSIIVLVTASTPNRSMGKLLKSSHGQRIGCAESAGSSALDEPTGSTAAASTDGEHERC